MADFPAVEQGDAVIQAAIDAAAQAEIGRVCLKLGKP